MFPFNWITFYILQKVTNINNNNNNKKLVFHPPDVIASLKLLWNV